MSFEDAIKIVQGGAIIDVEVTPGAKRACIPGGYNPWRKRIEVRLSENAHKGKANEQLLESFSELFGLPVSEVSIISGMKNTKKSILLLGIGLEQAVAVMKEGLENIPD